MAYGEMTEARDVHSVTRGFGSMRRRGRMELNFMDETKEARTEEDVPSRKQTVLALRKSALLPDGTTV